jgi:hypothetical protein
MKNVCKFATLTLMMFAVSVCGFSQQANVKKSVTATQNLVRGVIGPAGSNSSWSNYTVVNLIPGSGLFPITSSTTVFYYGSRVEPRPTSPIWLSTRRREAA